MNGEVTLNTLKIFVFREVSFGLHSQTQVGSLLLCLLQEDFWDESRQMYPLLPLSSPLLTDYT